MKGTKLKIETLKKGYMERFRERKEIEMGGKEGR